MVKYQGLKKRSGHFSNIKNTFLLAIVTTIFSTSSFYTFSFLFSYINSNFISEHPTSIPWIKSQIRCESSGRYWENNQCWDYKHSSSF